MNFCQFHDDPSMFRLNSKVVPSPSWTVQPWGLRNETANKEHEGNGGTLVRTRLDGVRVRKSPKGDMEKCSYALDGL